jgi:3-deoxy-manno-octulosonate cytidylyltransferase (CMP-KDO synthetase)
MTDRRQPPQKPIIIIPSRIGSTRLPRKPLADIAGKPMIVHVLERATESKLGPVVVACDHEEIAAAVRQAGGQAVMTKPEHPRGSDRIWEAFNALPDNAHYDAVINVQGDEPTLDPKHIRAAYDLLKNPAVDIATLAAEIRDEAKKTMSQVVKAVVDVAAGGKQGRGLYFSRQPVPSGDGPMYHHVGLYAYRREALAAFAAAPVSPVEERESLEQLRALAMGLRIEVGIIDGVPMGVDTAEDLARVREVLKGRSA